MAEYSMLKRERSTIDKQENLKKKKESVVSKN